jgi:hypothetical protein
MGTLVKGQTFSVCEQITNTKLHNLVDLATISGVGNGANATGYGAGGGGSYSGPYNGGNGTNGAVLVEW